MTPAVGAQVRVLDGHDHPDGAALTGRVGTVTRHVDMFDKLMGGAPDGAFYVQFEGDDTGRGFTPDEVEVLS